MPEVRVQDEQGNVHVFPDGSTPEMIAQAMNVKPPSANFNANAEASKPTELPGASEQLKRFAVGIPVGAAKSAAQTLFGTGQGPVDTSFIAAKTGVNPQQAQAGAQQFRRNIQLQGAGEHIGAAGEQAAEMLATGGPLRETTTILPKIAQRGGRIAAEAVNTAANAAVHGQDPNTAALAGTAGAALSEVLPSAADYLKQFATGQYTRALAPTKEGNKVLAQKVVPGLIERGVIGSPKSIAEKASANLGVAGQAVKSAEDAISPAAVSDVNSVLNRLQQLRNKYTVGGSVPESREATTNYIDSLRNDILKRSSNGKMLTSDLIQFRRMLDEPVAEAGGFVGKQMLGNKKIDNAAANTMRAILNTDNPDLAAANASYSFWSNVRKVAADTAKRQTGQQGAIKTLFTAAGIAGGLGHGGLTPAGAAEGAGAAGAMYLVASMIRSPQWRTASAVTKNAIADALSSDNAERFFRAGADFFAASASQHGQQLPSQ